MEPFEVYSARISLSGHAPTPARAELTHRSDRTRLTGALVALIGCWALAPLVFFIPPHIPWVLIALGAGIYLGRRQWRGAYVVRRLEGECPRCHAALQVTPGARIGLPHRMDCFSCHHEPLVELRPN